VAQEEAMIRVCPTVDTEAHPEAEARFGVRGIPAFFVLKGGEVVKEQAGLVPSAVMQSWLVEAEA
jgi:thioredoxin-like negative regulator of GroEL